MSNTFVFKPLINPLQPHIPTNSQKVCKKGIKNRFKGLCVKSFDLFTGNFYKTLLTCGYKCFSWVFFFQFLLPYFGFFRSIDGINNR